MPSAANAKSEKPASSEATDNSPIRQIMTIIEHKIRNLEKRKSKLTSYRDLQKAGKELNSDQKVAVAKYDEVAQTLEFARDLSKQITSIAISAEREAKKQAKKEAWIRYTADTNKIREVLLILDCLMQMGNNEAREDFLNGTNGAAKLTEEDLKILDDLYPEVTPKHDVNDEGQPGFPSYTMKAAEHLYSIVDGKPKEVLGTTYTHIKEIVTAVHECGYFDKVPEAAVEQAVPLEENHVSSPAPVAEPPTPAPYSAPLPIPPAPGVVPAPAYPLRAMPPLTLQEIEHAYFTQQYPQPRPIADVIGSQNFYFLQESEIDSPAATPQPTQPSPPGPAPIPSQTFTNQHFVGIAADGSPLPLPHFPPRPEHGGAYPVPMPAPMPAPLPAQLPPPPLQPAPPSPQQPAPTSMPTAPAPVPTSADEKPEDEWQETRSPEREDGERRGAGAGQGDARYRRYGRGGGRGAQQNGYRGRGGYSRPAGDYHRQPRSYDSNYRKDIHYNGDADSTEREPGSGYRGRGRGARPSRPPPRHYARKPDRPE